MAAYLTARQVAERWACSPKTVIRLAERGALAGVRVGDLWRFGVAAVEAYEAAHTTAAETVQPAPTPAPRKQEVRPPTTVDGFTLPADYEPVFKDLWPFHETKKAASQRH